ncbi:MAG: hypothetical protein GXN94_05660 [Aquificae bacterium]|nr:hypothetical protein [Aquificota bacterium]
MNKKYITAVSVVLAVLFVGGVVYGFAKYIASKNLQRQVETYLEKNDLKDSVKIQDYRYEPLSGEITLENLKIDRYSPFGFEITVGKLTIFEYDQPEGYQVPSRVKLSATGVRLEKDGKTYRYDLYQEIYYDREKNKYIIKQLKINGEGFLLEASAVFSNVREETIKNISENGEYGADLLEVIPEEGRFYYRDWGFLKSIDEDGEILETLQDAVMQTEGGKLKEILNGLLIIRQKGKGEIAVRFKNRKNLTLKQLAFMYVFVNAFQTDGLFFNPEDYIEIQVSYKGEGDEG